MELDALASELAGVTLYTDALDLLSYQRDSSVVAAGTPAMVARAANVADVAAVVSRAHRDAVPVYVRGGGTMYAGGVNPHAGGIVLDVSDMRSVLELDLARGVVVVEPGIRFGELLAVLEPHGQTIGIVPVTAPSATVGGAVAAHALGTGSPRHQSMGDCVAGLEVVLADGTRVRTGSAAATGGHFFQRYCIGPDLTGLFLGADGSLGVITAVALWLFPLPAVRETCCFGFGDPTAAGRFLADVQACELTRNMWYAAGYEAATIRGRLTQARPDLRPETLPGFCVGVEFGGAAQEIAADKRRLSELAHAHSGAEFPAFDEVYFRKLRFELPYWYSFAGYFSRSRCALLMTSLPCDRLGRYVDCVAALRERHAGYTWGAAVVVCRRGLHGGVIAFYDERTEWLAMQAVVEETTTALLDAGCVPYKSGKLWASRVREFDGYFNLLERIKQAVDPRSILSRGNLGL